MRFLQATLLGVHLAAVLAAPLASVTSPGKFVVARKSDNSTSDGEGEDANEIEQTGQFGTAITLVGGDVKQDTTFPAGTNGVLEIEFQNPTARTLTVTENKSPAAPPAGYIALEPVSYKVSLAEGATNLTLSKVDWIRNESSTLDISQGQIGRLCTEVGAFVIDAAVGELEFEADENELTLTVANMNGEWGIFLPNTTSTGATTTNSTTDSTTGSTLFDFIVGILQGR